MSNWFRRSQRQRVLAGICGSLGELCGADPVFFRLMWVLVSLVLFQPVLIYLLLWWFLPTKLEPIK